MEAVLDFEKPIASLEKKLFDLRELSRQQGVDLTYEIKILETKIDTLIRDTFSKLTPWQKVQVSRHPNRPYTSDYLENLFPDFMELQGDRCFGEDPAIISGVANLSVGSESLPLLIIGHQKGRTTQQKMIRNFGMAKPEGYRKTMRLMGMANRLRMPILTLIDTPGAYPGIETEERGQAQAIAESIRFMFSLNVPVLTVIIGEGGSGGALALAASDHIFMQEFSTYSVISPEGCASILWNDSKVAPQASEVLKMGPSELMSLGVVDGIIPEPMGGAHRDWDSCFKYFSKFLKEKAGPLFLDYISQIKGSEKNPVFLRQLREQRFNKFRKMGEFAIGRTKGSGSDASPSSPRVGGRKNERKKK